MARCFNTTGVCNPERHYMVNIDDKLKKIKVLVDSGAYFTINRARQYGKTTTLKALKKYISVEYLVVSLDFQFLSHINFESEPAFVKAFAKELVTSLDTNWLPDSVKSGINTLVEPENKEISLGELFLLLSCWCRESEKPIVLMIDEVDSATNNDVFLDFLALLRGYILTGMKSPFSIPSSLQAFTI